MEKIVFTTGYEGKTIDTFLNRLKKHSIQRIVDVREIPLSRKKGFSKNPLREKLAKYNIDYVHFKSLGSPTHLRKKVYLDKDFVYFFNRYEKYLEKCQIELETLYQAINEKVSCLLCFEDNPSNCHRSSVANRVSKLNGTSFQVQHI